MLPAALMLALALGAGASTSGPGLRTMPFFTSQSTPPTYTEGQRWGDLLAERDLSITEIAWTQNSPSLLGGSLVFELRNSNGTLLCTGSTTCNVARDTIVRATCSAKLAEGEQAVFIVAATSTCTTLPGGRMRVSGQYGAP